MGFWEVSDTSILNIRVKYWNNLLLCMWTWYPQVLTSFGPQLLYQIDADQTPIVHHYHKKSIVQFSHNLAPHPIPMKLGQNSNYFSNPHLHQAYVTLVWILSQGILPEEALIQDWRARIFLINQKTCVTPWSVLMVHALLRYPYLRLAFEVRLVYKYANCILK